MAVNARLAELPGAVLGINHSANVAASSVGVDHQFSTLITYTDWKAPGEDAGEDEQQ